MYGRNYKKANILKNVVVTCTVQQGSKGMYMWREDVLETNSPNLVYKVRDIDSYRYCKIYNIHTRERISSFEDPKSRDRSF